MLSEAYKNPVQVEELLSDRGRRLCVLALNRVHLRNCLDHIMLQQMSEVLQRFASSPLVLTARPPAFCSGMDLFFLSEANRIEGGLRRAIDRLLEVYRQLLQHPRPTAALVDGAAIGGGVGLALSCDLVLATSRSTFSLPSGGMRPLAAIVHPLIRRRTGVHWGGEEVTASQAKSLGLINDVVSISGERSDLIKVMDSVLDDFDRSVDSRSTVDSREWTSILDDAFKPASICAVNAFLADWVATQTPDADRSVSV